MKKLSTTITVLLYFICINATKAQIVNWEKIDSTKHMFNVNTGFDYSFSIGLGYSYNLYTKFSILLNSTISKPSGNQIFDDYKTKIGGQILLLNHSNFKGAVSLHGIHRGHSTKYIRLLNFGSEAKVTMGYHRPKWFLGLETGFDKAIVTHFKHSSDYKENIYQNAIDGWFEPTTGGNFTYGLQSGVSINKFDLVLNLGRVIPQDFKSSALIPYYFSFGINYSLNKK